MNFFLKKKMILKEIAQCVISYTKERNDVYIVSLV